MTQELIKLLLYRRRKLKKNIRRIGKEEKSFSASNVWYNFLNVDMKSKKKKYIYFYSPSWYQKDTSCSCGKVAI